MTKASAFICSITTALLLLLSGASSASPWVDITACDSVQVGGVFYPPVNSPEYPFCTALLIPHAPAAPGDTCRGIATSAPTGWGSEVSGDRIIYSLIDGKMSCILPGQSVLGFQVVLSKGHNCCYDLWISGNLFEPFAQDLVCFNCDLPSPARTSSWGMLKSIYRR